MQRRKRTITVSETATLLSVNPRSTVVRRDWCSECAAEVAWIELPTVIQLSDLSGSGESCVVHLNDGLVCSRSLTGHLKNLYKE